MELIILKAMNKIILQPWNTRPQDLLSRSAPGGCRVIIIVVNLG